MRAPLVEANTQVMNGHKPLLLVTCDTLPNPPLDGHNRKVHDVLHALHEEFEIRALGYAESDKERQATALYWADVAVKWTFLSRKKSFRHLRAVWRGLSLPTVTRNFDAEYTWLKGQAAGRQDVRVLIDFISGAPLLDTMHGPGLILSGHDCMSYLFRQEAVYARNWRQAWHARIRSRFAANAEKRYAHFAERVHVVSAQDAVEFVQQNPRVKVAMIPLAGCGAFSRLKPYDERAERVIWGNLRSDLIQAGVIRLLESAGAARPFSGWRMVGGLEEKMAMARVPLLADSGIRYQARVDDVSALLANTSRLCLPDIGGTGQKNRTLDGLAHGCCVIGLLEVFRGIEVEQERAGLIAHDHAELTRIATADAGHDFAGTAERGYRLFRREFSLDVLRRRWRELILGCGCILPAAWEQK